MAADLQYSLHKGPAAVMCFRSNGCICCRELQLLLCLLTGVETASALCKGCSRGWPTDIGPSQAAPAVWPLAKAKGLLPPEELLRPVARTQDWFQVGVCWLCLGVSATLPKASFNESISWTLRYRFRLFNCTAQTAWTLQHLLLCSVEAGTEILLFSVT